MDVKKNLNTLVVHEKCRITHRISLSTENMKMCTVTSYFNEDDNTVWTVKERSIIKMHEREIVTVPIRANAES